jgi:hypothetical protein
MREGETMKGTLADFLKENGLTEAEAMRKLEVIQKDEEKQYYKALHNAWELQELKKLLSLLVSNQRDKGDMLSFITNQSKLKMYQQIVNL